MVHRVSGLPTPGELAKFGYRLAPTFDRCSQRIVRTTWPASTRKSRRCKVSTAELPLASDATSVSCATDASGCRPPTSH